MVDPPSLPRHLGEIRTVVAVGTGLWLVGVVGLGLAWLVGGRGLDLWFSTCVAGAVLGAVGHGIFSWQRAAARRGSRTAQRVTDY